MIRTVRLLSRLATSIPFTVILIAVVLTGVLDRFATEQQMATGNEGFAPENAELQALERTGELFGDSTEEVLQVVIRSEAGDVITAAGLEAVRRVEEAVRAEAPAGVLSDRPDRPAVVSYLTPLQQALILSGEGSAPDDPTVDQLYRTLDRAPREQLAFVRQLLSERADPTAATSPSGLVLVFLDASTFRSGGEGFDRLIELQSRLAEAVRATEMPAGIAAEPFSFPLLFADQDAFQEEVSRLFSQAVLIIALILGFVYWVRPRGGAAWASGLRRTVADVLLTLAAIFMSVVWMNGIGVLLGPDYLGLIGHSTAPTQVIPVLLVGLGVDYAIHLTSRYRQELADGADVETAARRAIHTVGVALVLATVTTGVGFLTNLVNPVPALQDFGILAAVGIGAAFLLMLLFVPAVRILLDRRAQRAHRLPRSALAMGARRTLPELTARTAVLAERLAVPTLVVALLLAGLGGWGLLSLETRFSVTDFVPEGSPVLDTLEVIEEEFAGGFGETTQVLLEGPVATPEAHNALVETLTNMEGTEGVVRLGDRVAAESPLSVLAAALTGPGEPPTWATGVNPDLTVAPETDVAAIYRHLLETVPDQATRILHGQGDQFTAQIILRTQTGEEGAGELRAALVEDAVPLEEAGVSAIPTSNNIVTAVIVRALQDSQVSSLLTTLLVAMLVLIITFWVEARRPFLGVITIAPVALVVLWTFGLMAVTGIPLGPVTATLAALAVGIGVPYTIHVTHRFLEDLDRHTDLEGALRSTVRHTGGALAGSALTTVAGFGILVTSSLTPFQQMGLVTAYAIGLSLLAAVLILPSMLALWDRWHRPRGRHAARPTRSKRTAHGTTPIGSEA